MAAAGSCNGATLFVIKGPISPNDGYPRLGLSAENKGPGSAQAQFLGVVN